MEQLAFSKNDHNELIPPGFNGTNPEYEVYAPDTTNFLEKYKPAQGGFMIKVEHYRFCNIAN
jgi:hypothetical protein